MAELDYDQMSDAPRFELPRMGQIINFSGAIVSLGLIGGLAWWGYDLIVRDVSGVPVVRALEGPMRVAPEEPGGEVAEHVGLSVNAIPAEGIADEPAERIILAPVTNELGADDLPIAELDEIVAAEAIAANPPSVEEAAEAQNASIDDLIGAALAEATGTVEGPDGQPMSVIPPDIPGVSKSLIPLARPTSMAAIAPLPVADDGVVIVEPSAIAEGTRLAQLGAFDTITQARDKWASLAQNFPEFMTDKARVIEPAQSGGKQFFRLRAHGFEGLSDARRFCAALMAAEENCIPVKQR
jgi:hypothetical protein